MATKNVYVPIAVLLIVILFGCLLVSCNKKAKTPKNERFSGTLNTLGSTPQRGSHGTPPSGAFANVIPSNGMQDRRDLSIAAKADASANPGLASGGIGSFGASDPNGDEMYNPVSGTNTTNGLNSSGNCFPRDRLSASDLLPQGAADSKWSQANPAGQGDVRDQNFLTAGYHIGINTTGSTKKNGNLQLRSEPFNPQVVVSPWNQASIEPDYLRRPLEIGGDY
jgi:hypothetical protein